MTRPAPHVAARRRLVALYMPSLVAAAVMFLANYPVINSGTVFGALVLLGVMMTAAVDLEANL
ncbi:hypothetical protein [Paeniglutamicibacter sp.]|uniref:hypothetical protein n=1 Tax=Paeniglutamicibacter sp. TaxID=1934391 RepID=UPI003989E1B4